MLFRGREMRRMPRTMGERLRHRAQIWLRSERALGLTSVRHVRRKSLGADGTKAQTATTATKPAPGISPRPVVSRPAPIAAKAPPVVMGVNTHPSANALFRTPFDSTALQTPQKVAQLAAMDVSEVSVCTKCALCKTRTKTVFGEGDPNAKIFFIGEGPGETEDLTGRPFVGKAGQLLDKMIQAMGLQREQVFIANIVKCRPPGNRVPEPAEVQSCTAYLERQLEIVRPSVIVTLGLPATRYMLQSTASMGSMRGRFHSWRGIQVMPTYHPAYVLRSYTKQTREAVWSDLQQVMTFLNLKLPFVARKSKEPT
jgi:uracil-DNA glycosylase family 4